MAHKTAEKYLARMRARERGPIRRPGRRERCRDEDERGDTADATGTWQSHERAVLPENCGEGGCEDYRFDLSACSSLF